MCLERQREGDGDGCGRELGLDNVVGGLGLAEKAVENTSEQQRA